MANRNKGRRGRSRKRRPAPASTAAGAITLGDASPGDSLSAGSARAGAADGAKERGRTPPKSGGRRAQARPREATPARGGGLFRDPGSVGDRPRSPWHPLPLSELLILVGAIGTVVGLRKGVSHGGPPLFAGLGAVLIGTVEVSLREHLSGYRSHTIILAVLAVIAFHTAVVLGVAALTRVPLVANAVLLAFDAALFTFLFKLLRARFLDARRERTFARRH